jgi:hypothetical protein
MEPQEYDDLIRHLVRIAAHQDTINTDLRESIRQQAAINERLATAIERLDTTQARIETLLARMIERSPNGRDA